MSASLSDFAPQYLFAGLTAQDYSFFIGNGRRSNWIALKRQPHSKLLVNEGKPWLEGEAVSRNSLMFCLGTRWIRVIAIAEPRKSDEGDKSALGEGIEEAFRFGGVELVFEGSSLAGAFSAAISDRPREASGDGWQAGSAFSPGSTLFTLAATGKARGDKGGAGLWVSASAGYFEEPGLAIATELTWRPVPLWPRAGPRSPEFGFALFLCGCAGGYRVASGDLPSYDFFADLKGTLKIGQVSIGARALLCSLPEEKTPSGSRLLRDQGISGIETLLWLWRTDIAKATLELRIPTCSFSSQAMADIHGFRRGLSSFRYTPAFIGKPSVATSASLKVSYSRSDAVEDGEDSEGTEEDPFSWSVDGFAGAGLLLRAIDVDWGLSWKGTASRAWFRQGEIGAALSIDWKDASPVFSLSFGLSQVFRLSPCAEFSVSVKSPEGGYSLEALPTSLPDFAMAVSLFDD